MKYLLSLFLAASLLLLTSGCGVQGTPTPDPVTVSETVVNKMSTVVALATSQASATPAPALAISTPTPTATPDQPSPTSTRAPVFRQVCLPVQNPPPGGLSPPGVIVLGGAQARLYALKTLGQPATPLGSPGSKYQFLVNVAATSPDGKEFMYLEGWPDPKGYIPMHLALRIIRSDGRRRAVSQPWDFRWNAIASWFGPESVLMAWDVAYKGRMTVVDPFTGSAHDLAPILPNIYQSHLPGTQWDNATSAVYSPDQNQVVYLRDEQVDPMYQMVLWDIKTKTVLWQRVDRGALGHTPEWSPDGSAFAMAIDTGKGTNSQDELFLVDRSGAERQLTDLSSSGDLAVIRGLTWAPDGQSLAFWLDYRHAGWAFETEQLGILNLATGQITLYCFGSGSSRPVWSPGSTAIAFEIDPVNEPSQTILLDLAGESAYLLAENAYPAAWLKSP